MKTKTVTVHEGEWLGPVDQNYNYQQHSWGPSKGGVNPDSAQKGWTLIQNVKVGDDVLVSHTEGWKEVLAVGMYDGWPFWRPTPAVLVRTWAGGERHFLYDIYDHNPCTCAVE